MKIKSWDIKENNNKNNSFKWLFKFLKILK